jgi:L-ascorbate metabolism protein UlaG (beta-lactamase superfamily)
MKMQLIRNATLRLTYAGHTFVIDPCLAPKHSLPSYAGNSANPLVELSVSRHAVIRGIEMVVVSHLHTDHFDQLAQESLSKDTMILCQPGNKVRIREMGFLEVIPVTTKVCWNTITIRRTPGRHGSSETVLSEMGEVSGFVFEAENEPTVYWAGDTIWYDEIKKNISQWRPDIIITHSGGAVWGENELIPYFCALH